MNYYTADLHFGHANVINFDHRPFSDVEEMDRHLIMAWNERVQINDTVFIVGDFCFRGGNPADWYLKQLAGHKVLVVGNHDSVTLRNREAVKLLDGIEKMLHISDEGQRIQLCHFPIIEWNGFHRGAWHIYGHIHNRKDDTYEYMRNRERALNAGCMINGYRPVTFRELVENNRAFQAGEE